MSVQVTNNSPANFYCSVTHQAPENISASPYASFPQRAGPPIKQASSEMLKVHQARVNVQRQIATTEDHKILKEYEMFNRRRRAPGVKNPYI